MLHSSSDYYIQAVFTGLLPRILEIDPRANHAGFMLNKMALGQSFAKSISVFPFDCYLAVCCPVKHLLSQLFNTNDENGCTKHSG
jgi:hypothetical protein